MPLLGETDCRKVAAISHKFYNFTQFYSSAQLASVCRQVKVFHANYGHSNLIATKVTQETFWCKQPPGSTRQPIRESSLANRGYQVLNEWSLGLCALCSYYSCIYYLVLFLHTSYSKNALSVKLTPGQKSLVLEQRSLVSLLFKVTHNKAAVDLLQSLCFVIGHLQFTEQ